MKKAWKENFKFRVPRSRAIRFENSTFRNLKIESPSLAPSHRCQLFFPLLISLSVSLQENRETGSEISRTERKKKQTPGRKTNPGHDDTFPPRGLKAKGPPFFAVRRTNNCHEEEVPSCATMPSLTRLKDERQRGGIWGIFWRREAVCERVCGKQSLENEHKAAPAFNRFFLCLDYGRVDGLHSSSILYLLASFPSLSTNKAQLRAMASVSPSSNEGEIARWSHSGPGLEKIRRF